MTLTDDPGRDDLVAEPRMDSNKRNPSEVFRVEDVMEMR